MKEDIVIVDSDGNRVPLEQCETLTMGEMRPEGSRRDFSTHLYTSGEWNPTVPGEKLASFDPLGRGTVVRFKLDHSLTHLVSERIFGGDLSVEANTTDLGDKLAGNIRDAVCDRIGISPGELSIRRQLKPIASLPSRGLTAGKTTDGLHLDARQSRAVIRVGLNLGSASRFVICGLTSLRLLQDVLGGDIPATSVTHAATYEYGRLIGKELRVIRFEVPADYGWMMETTNVLHDGRRAHPELPSRFVLMEAEVM